MRGKRSIIGSACLTYPLGKEKGQPLIWLLVRNNMDGIKITSKIPTLKYWLIAIRPKTLTIAAVPVLIGNTLAWVEISGISGPVMLITLMAALLIQIGTNLYNDAADADLGADDSSKRLGPPRVSSQGWLSSSKVRRAAILSFVLAALLLGYLVSVGGWPIMVAGLSSIWAGWAYTGGSKPIAYLGGGELFVFVFFGIVTVAASYYLQTSQLTSTSILLGAMIGLPAAAILVVNNYRDIDGDRQAGKNTLAVRLGRRASKIEYSLLLLIPYILLFFLEKLGLYGKWLLIPALSIPWALYLIRQFCHEGTGAGLNRLLVATTHFHAGFGALLCIAILGATRFAFSP